MASGRKRDPSEVHRGILERKALRNSTQSKPPSSATHFLRFRTDQAQEIFLQTFHLHQQAGWGNPGIHQQQVDLLGMFDGRSPLKLQRPIRKEVNFVPGSGEDAPRGFRFAAANEQTSFALSFELSGIHLAQQTPLVDDAHPVRQAGDFGRGYGWT